MKKIYKILIIVLAFLIVAVAIQGDYLTNQAKWMGIRQTGNHSDEGAVIIADTFQRVNKYPNYNVWEINYDSIEEYIYSFMVYNKKLYAGTGPNGKIYSYDGDTWSLSYDSISTEIYSLEIFGNNLYAGGRQGNIYIFDGSSWSLLKNLGVDQIWSLKVYSDKLYAGTGSGGKVFVYDGSSWTESYDSSETHIYSLTVFEGKLYAGSGEHGIIYVYDGTSWSTEYDTPENEIRSLNKYSGKLYAGTGPNGKVYSYGTLTSLQLDSVSGYSTNCSYSLTSNPIKNAFDRNLDTYAELNNRLEHLGVITGAGAPNYLNGANSIYISNNTAYVVSLYDHTFTTFNITNASNIIHMGNISGAGAPNYLNGAFDIYVSNGIAYIVSYVDNALTTFNVTNASNIIHMGNISGAGAPNYLNGAYDIYILNDIAYVISYTDAALTTFNVTNASNIIHMGNISGAGAPNYLNGARSIYVSNGIAYIVSYDADALTTFDVTNASNIIHIDTIIGDGAPNYLNGAYDIYVSNDIVYIVSYIDDALTTFKIPSDDRVVDWNFTIPNIAASIDLSTKIDEWFNSGGCNISCYNYTGTKWIDFTRRKSSSIETGDIPTDCFSGQTNLQLRCLLTNNSPRVVTGIRFYDSYIDIGFTRNWSVSYDGSDEEIYSLEEYNEKFYTGTGRTGGIYIYDGIQWIADYDIKEYTPLYIRSLGTYNGALYAGTGDKGTIYSYQTEPRQEMVIKNTADESVPVNITDSITLKANATVMNVPLPINISNYGFKEYIANIINNATHKSTVAFNSRLEHLIITPNESSAIYRWKLTQDSDGTIIYDATGLDYTGRTGIIVNVPLIGNINISIQNASLSINTSVKMVYT